LNFRKLEVTGFKSFADKIEVEFEPGTTAIVGPNGCGKSNICDAIKWALGEQNARILRCEKMESLIFNGGSTRQQLGMAQVTLTIANSGKILPTEYTDVEIARRLFRSGESEYYINRKRCLLKDIQEIFMDTGLGVNSYSLMEQGHIDMILNSTPQERRLILEEAAGITKFRNRKKSALRKLESTEQNLVRINDILFELEKQVASLKRQASKARRYQNYHNELKEMDTNLSLYRYGALTKEFKAVQEKMVDSDDRTRAISTGITKLEADLETYRLEMTSSEKKLADLRTQERRAQSQIEETESEIAVLKERRSNLKQRQEGAAEELSNLQKQLQDSDKQIKSIEVEKGKLSESISTQENELKLSQERADELTEATAVAEKNAEELKNQTIDVLNKKARIQNELSNADSRLDYLVTRLDRLVANSENLGKEHSQLEDKVAEIQEEINKEEKEIGELTAKQERLSSEFSQLQSKVAQLDKEIREIEQGKNASSSRLQSLQELQEAYEGYDAGVKALLGKTTKKKDAGLNLEGIRHVIAEIIKTEAQYELAIEASLGSNIQDIVTDTTENAKFAVEHLKDQKGGKATLLPIDALQESEGIIKTSSEATEMPDGVLATALQVVNFDAEYEPVVKYLLGQTIIVNDLDTAIKLAEEDRKQKLAGSNGNLSSHTKFVTLDGQIVSWSGVITGGTGAESASLLRRSRQINDLKRDVIELDKKLTDKTAERDNFAAEISERQDEQEETDREIQRKRISHAGLKKDFDQYKQRAERLEKEISVIDSECDSLEKEIVNLEESKKRLAKDSVELEKQSEDINKKIASLQEEVKTKIQQRDAVVQQCTNIRVQLASKKQEEKGLSDKLRSMEQTKKRIIQTLSSRQSSVSSDKEAESDIAEKITTQEKALEELFQSRSQIEAGISKMETQRQAAQVNLSNGESSLREHRRDLDDLGQGKYQLEVSKTQLQMNIDSLVLKMRERYGVSLEEIKSQSPDDKADELSEDELVGRIEELRTRMDNMGSVNLTAVDEYNRQSERYDLLVSQKEDLLKAKDSLYSIIQRINRESRDRLKETYDAVNISFQELFRTLFGGGQAELVMIGDGDVLDSGIDIKARPPGKKPQSISMLSSGERSLTAIAMMFALFKIKPSPFCVMDEVDAALDDANVGRFTNMLKEFSTDTQFIIITHNKRTMQIADVLYGVTMEESGVSKLVSLKMNKDDEANQLAS